MTDQAATPRPTPPPAPVAPPAAATATTATTPSSSSRTPTRRRRAGRGGRGGGLWGTSARRAESLAGLGMTLPAAAVFAVFMFWPLLLTGWYSLHAYSGFGAMRWVGPQNYQRIAGDATFWHALVNTVLFTAISVPLGVAASLGAALLLNDKLPARGLLRALLYVPVVISGVVSGVIFLRLFDPITGLINQLLAGAHLPTVDWQGNGWAALVSIIAVTTWQGLGFGMVVYLAALQGIPAEVYEAAALDGATGWRRFTHITLPLLKPTTFFMVVYSIIGSFQVFDVVYVMTRGGPGTATTFLVQYAYDTGFNQRKQGYAAAIGVILYAIVMVLTLLQWRTRDEETRG